ncbi:MAG: hypothetical protein ACRCZS_14035, partial [Chroococcidiopsis sp.]
SDSVVLAWLPSLSVTTPLAPITGISFLYNDIDPPTASGQIRTLQASLNVATSVAINAADSNGDSTTDITARLKTGAIFTIAKDGANYVRLEATADYASGAVAVVVRAEQGAISSGDTVFLAIASDAPSVGGGGAGGFSAGTISATPGSSTATIIESTAPSGSTWPIYTYQWFMSTASNFDSASNNLVAGATNITLTLSGLAQGTQYFLRRLVRDAAGQFAATPEINFTTTGANPSVVALINALTAQGYTPSAGEQTAIANFFSAIGLNNAAGTATLQSAFARFRGFLGNAFNPCRIDWIDPSNAARYLTVNSTITYGSAGITTGTASAAMREDFIIPASAQNSFGFGLYLGAAPTANQRYMGSLDSATNTQSVISTGNSPNIVASINSNTSSVISYAPASYSKGFYALSRTGATASYINVNGVTTTSTSSSQAAATYYDNANSRIGIGAMIRSDGTHFGVTGTVIGCSFLLNSGIPSADMESIRTAIVQLMTALARN